MSRKRTSAQTNSLDAIQMGFARIGSTMVEPKNLIPVLAFETWNRPDGSVGCYRSIPADGCGHFNELFAVRTNGSVVTL